MFQEAANISQERTTRRAPVGGPYAHRGSTRCWATQWALTKPRSLLGRLERRTVSTTTATTNIVPIPIHSIWAVSVK
jgi:hypothetical protein